MRSSAPVLTPEEVQIHLQDVPDKNHLLDGTEFNPAQIMLAIELAISEFNMLSPVSAHDLTSFPSKAILMNGTLAKLYAGQAALLARNTMSYSDGGLQIPVEERYAMYVELSARYGSEFLRASQAYKINVNMEAGWGSVASDYANFPSW